MPWVEAILRGQRVLARVKADGALDVEGGRVEIRYKPNDGRAYRAAARNVEPAPGGKVLPDDACGPAVAPTEAPAKSGSRSTPARQHAIPAGAWIAYTDGACSGNPGPAGSGIVLVSPDGKMHEGWEYLGEATNNVAELTAIVRAAQWAPRDVALVIHTDSQYSIGVLQKNWKAKANQELIEGAKRLLRDRGALLVYVPGHQGVALNERADELAREAVQTRRSRAAAVP
jgi:ribonuclease HI